MYLNCCDYCHSECFCNCHQHYINQSDDLTYQFDQSYYPKYETAQFRSSYSNGLEGDTMTSLSEKWKYSQPLKQDHNFNKEDSMNRDVIKKSLINQNEEFGDRLMPKRNQYLFNQQQERPNLDELLKENEKLLKLNRDQQRGESESKDQSDFDDSGRRNYSQTFAGSNDDLKQSQGDERMGLLNNNNKRSDDSGLYKDALEESLGFIKYVAMKEGVNYIDDRFYIQNITPFKKLIDTLKKSLYGESKALDEQNRNQFERAVNVIQNEKTPPIQIRNDNVLLKDSDYSNKIHSNLNPYSYEMLPNQNKQLNNEQNQMRKEPIGTQFYKAPNQVLNEPIRKNQIHQMENQDSCNNTFKQNSQLNTKNQIPNSQMKRVLSQDKQINREPINPMRMNPLYVSNKQNEVVPQSNISPMMMNKNKDNNVHYPMNKGTMMNNSNNNKPNSILNDNFNQFPKQQPQNPPQENTIKKQLDIPKGNKANGVSKSKPIPTNKPNNNANSNTNQPIIYNSNPNEIYYQSFKENPGKAFNNVQNPNQNQNKPLNQPGRIRQFSPSVKTQNQLKNSNNNNQNSIFPIYNSYNDKPKQQKNAMLQRSYSQITNLRKDQNNSIEIHNKQISNFSPHQRDTSPSRDCFACNVQCNISSTGYSPMTYSPYGDKKRRRSVTPLKN